jgi:hypothetical protein
MGRWSNRGMPRRRSPLFLVYSGTALDGHVYRIVRGCPPTLDDLRSYEVLRKRYDRSDFFRGTGVSMMTNPESAVAVARRFGLGQATAVLDLRIDGVVWTESGRPNHITVWAPPELLLTRVVECEHHG